MFSDIAFFIFWKNLVLLNQMKVLEISTFKEFLFLLRC